MVTVAKCDPGDSNPEYSSKHAIISPVFHRVFNSTEFADHYGKSATSNYQLSETVSRDQ